MPSYRSAKNGEGVSTAVSEYLRTRDVRQGVSEAGFGQGRSAEYEHGPREGNRPEAADQKRNRGFVEKRWGLRIKHV